MSIIIDEVVSEIIRPAAPVSARTDLDHRPADARPADGQIIAAMKRAEYRANRLSAN